LDYISSGGRCDGTFLTSVAQNHDRQHDDDHDDDDHDHDDDEKDEKESWQQPQQHQRQHEQQRRDKKKNNSNHGWEVVVRPSAVNQSSRSSSVRRLFAAASTSNSQAQQQQQQQQQQRPRPTSVFSKMSREALDVAVNAAVRIAEPLVVASGLFTNEQGAGGAGGAGNGGGVVGGAYASAPSGPRSRPRVVVLEPGDSLYIPPFWSHSVESLNFAVSINVFTPSQEGSALETWLYGTRFVL
jgi:hypothetical protein